MTIYLTEKTNKGELQKEYNSGAVFAAKLYPAGATTNSDSGVKDIKKMERFKTCESISKKIKVMHKSKLNLKS